LLPQPDGSVSLGLAFRNRRPPSPATLRTAGVWAATDPDNTVWGNLTDAL